MRHALLLALLAATLWPGGAGAAPTRFRWPAVDPNGDLFMSVPVVHVDHDKKTDGTNTLCTNYAGKGLPWCYDGHDGTDYLLKWSFSTMDKHDVQVVAGAAGVVTEAVDGNYDRCHETSGFKVTCDGHPMKSNTVSVRHADGLLSRYAHLKKGSVKVKVGQQVRCGDLLGYVGSSGRSARPHLHFEVRDAQGKLLDPYAGPLSQPTSYWTQQQGQNGMPGTRCQGEKILDAGVEAGLGGDGTPVATLPVGCALGQDPAAAPEPLPLLLVLLMLAFLRVR